MLLPETNGMLRKNVFVPCVQYLEKKFQSYGIIMFSYVKQSYYVPHAWTIQFDWYLLNVSLHPLVLVAILNNSFFYLRFRFHTA